MSRRKKRRLNKQEVEELNRIINSAPQGFKPSLRQLAKHFGVNKPSILKSLGGWGKTHYQRPQNSPKSQIIQTDDIPIIQGYTTKIGTADEKKTAQVS